MLTVGTAYYTYLYILRLNEESAVQGVQARPSPMKIMAYGGSRSRPLLSKPVQL